MRIRVSASSRLTTGAGTFVHIIKPSIRKAGYNGLAEGATVHFDVIDRRGKQLADNLRVKRGWRRHSPDGMSLTEKKTKETPSNRPAKGRASMASGKNSRTRRAGAGQLIGSGVFRAQKVRWPRRMKSFRDI